MGPFQDATPPLLVEFVVVVFAQAVHPMPRERFAHVLQELHHFLIEPPFRIVHWHRTCDSKRCTLGITKARSGL